MLQFAANLTVSDDQDDPFVIQHLGPHWQILRRVILHAPVTYLFREPAFDERSVAANRRVY
jgi:hypothetical protein